jgi:GxxExxY protein
MEPQSTQRLHEGYEPLPPGVEETGSAIVDCGVAVHRLLGPGLLESAYEVCLVYELQARGCNVRRQVPLPVVYRSAKLDAGYRLDLLVNGHVIVEVKSVDTLAPIHQAQLLTYMKLSGHRLGFLMNFNVTLLKQGIKRMVL